MDLASLVKTDAVFDLELRHPATDEPIGVVWKIRSNESDEVQEAQRKHADKLLESRGKLTTAKMKDQYLDAAAAAVAGWNWGENTINGEVPEFSTEKARSIMEKHGWIYDQVARASENRANFIVT
jgi:hypothetical protein